MDWEKLRRQPRIDHSRAGSRLDIRKESQPIRGLDQHDYYTGPRPAPPLPRTEEETIEQYAAEIYAAHVPLSPRSESVSTGVYQHSQSKSTPLRKGSDATGTDLYAESLNRTESIDSSETSRTSSRGTGAAVRIKSFKGLPPLAFEAQSDEHFNSETTLSLESTFEKIERVLTDTSSISNSARSIAGTIASSSSVAGTFGRDTSEAKPTNAPTFDISIFEAAEQNSSKKNSTMTNSTITTSNRTTTTTKTDSSGETIQFVLRQSAFPQDPLPELPELSQQISQENIHPLLRLPTATSEQDDAPPLPARSPLRQLPLPILTLNDAPSQQPPPSVKGRASIEGLKTTPDRDRTLQAERPATSRSLSSNNTHRPIQEEVSYSYWRLSRPKSWASEDEEIRDAPRKMSSASMPQQQLGASRGVFGVFGKVFGGSKNSNKTAAGQPPKKNELHRASTAQDYSIPGVLPHDFPIQRKTFLAAFTEQPAKGKSTIKESANRPTKELHRPVTTHEDLRDEKHYNLPGVLPDDFPMQRKNFLGTFSSRR